MYFVPAFSGLYAPHWKESARGVMLGLTRYATRAHIARAALEATAYQMREVLEAMEQDSGSRFTELRVDGGMVRNELLMQFQADMLDFAGGQRPRYRDHGLRCCLRGRPCHRPVAFADGNSTG